MFKIRKYLCSMQQLTDQTLYLYGKTLFLMLEGVDVKHQEVYVDSPRLLKTVLESKGINFDGNTIFDGDYSYTIKEFDNRDSSSFSILEIFYDIKEGTFSKEYADYMARVLKSTVEGDMLSIQKHPEDIFLAFYIEQENEFKFDSNLRSIIESNDVDWGLLSTCRMRSNLEAILASNNVVSILSRVAGFGYLRYFDPALDLLVSQYSFNLALRVLKEVQNNLLERLAALFILTGKPRNTVINDSGVEVVKPYFEDSAAIAEEALKKLCFTQAVILRVKDFILHAESKDFSKMSFLPDDEDLANLNDFRVAWCSVMGRVAVSSSSHVKETLTFKDLKISYKELLSLTGGVDPKETILFLLDSVKANPYLNTNSVLIGLAKNFLMKNN